MHNSPPAQVLDNPPRLANNKKGVRRRYGAIIRFA